MAQLYNVLFFILAGFCPLHNFINATEAAKANIVFIKAAVSYAG